MSKDQAIPEIIIMLATAYPNFTLTKETASIYERLLRDIPTDLLRAAALQCATTSRFFPSIAELRAAVGDIKRQVFGVPSPYEAWEELIKAPLSGECSRVIQENGQYIVEKWDYRFSHPSVERVARQLGWPKSFPGNEDQVMADRAHFLKAYEYEIESRSKNETQLPEVKGYIAGGTPGEQMKQLADKLGAHHG